MNDWQANTVRHGNPWTEDELERAVERKVDALDKQFLNSPMSQREYDEAMRSIDNWATMQRLHNSRL